MAVKLRLKRMGRRHRSFFRLCAMDSRVPRNGRAIEELGWYDPCARENDADLNAERIQYWLSVGAQPSETVRDLLKRHGIGAKPGAALATPAAATVEATPAAAHPQSRTETPTEGESA